MWLFIYKKYHNSQLATLLSVAGLMLRFAALIIVCSADFVRGGICFAAGCAAHFVAEQIHFTKWVKVIQSEGLEKKLRKGNLAVAGELYKIYPSKRTVRYITQVNPKVGQQLSDIIAQVNAEEKKK